MWHTKEAGYAKQRDTWMLIAKQIAEEDIGGTKWLEGFRAVSVVGFASREMGASDEEMENESVYLASLPALFIGADWSGQGEMEGGLTLNREKG